MNSISSQTLESIKLAANLFRSAKKIIALSGAGISTPSGIPDFRSAGSGLWAQSDSMDVASLNTFRARPEHFFTWFRPLATQIYNAEPNDAHLALATLEKSGNMDAVITQNIDLLHHRAGSKKVIEVHGSLQSFSCIKCYRHYDYNSLIMPYIDNGQIPLCPECGAILKPDIILFGEQLPHKPWLEAQRYVRNCDLIMVAGSSLEVLPAARLPLEAVEHGAHLIIINQSSTYLDERADIVIRDDVAMILPAIAHEVLDAILR